MRGKHHYTIELVTIYDDEPQTIKILFKTNKRAIAEWYVYTHEYLRIDDSDYCYRFLNLRKDF